MEPIEVDPPLREIHAQAVSAFNGWRGYCVDRFARIEHASALLLAALAKNGTMGDIKQPRMFSQRIEHLRKAMDGDGPFPPLRAKLGKSLLALALAIEQRNRIVHAVGTISVDTRGQWIWTLSFSPNGKIEEVEKGWLRQADGKTLHNQLKCEVDRFSGLAENLRHSLAA